MSGMNIIRKSFWKSCGSLYFHILPKKCMRSYVKHLKKLGVKISDQANFISLDAYFDSNDYSIIEIGKNVVISTVHNNQPPRQ